MKPVFVVLIILGVIGLGILAYRAEQKRRRLLRAWARASRSRW